MLKFYAKKGLPVAMLFFAYFYWLMPHATLPPYVSGIISTVGMLLLFSITKDTCRNGAILAGAVTVISILLTHFLAYPPVWVSSMMKQEIAWAFTLRCVITAVMLGALLPSLAYLLTCFREHAEVISNLQAIK